jgi:hypothetical protein
MAEDKAAKKRATDDLNDIETLRKIPAFNRYFSRRIWEEVDKLLEKVLHDKKLTPEKLHEARLLYLAAKETAELLTGDEAACRRLIDSSSED